MPYLKKRGKNNPITSSCHIFLINSLTNPTKVFYFVCSLQIMNLNTYTAVVTGATKGIGRAIAEKFAQNGFVVIFCSRSQKDVDSFSAYIKHTYQVECFGMACNMGKKEEVIAFGKFILTVCKTPDVLVNNAGQFIPGTIGNEEDGVFEELINVNLSGAYHLTRSVLPAMKEAQNGYIFNICSTASIVPYINGGSYCISKFALLGFSKVLREELKEHSIPVSAVLPGATLTDSWQGTDMPKSRFMKAENVAEAIWYAWQNRENCVMEQILLRPIKGDL